MRNIQSICPQPFYCNLSKTIACKIPGKYLSLIFLASAVYQKHDQKQQTPDKFIEKQRMYLYIDTTVYCLTDCSCMVFVISLTLTASTGICIAKRLSVYSPKDARLKKFPHMPIICPINRPIQEISAILPKESLKILQNINPNSAPAKIPP